MNNIRNFSSINKFSAGLYVIATLISLLFSSCDHREFLYEEPSSRAILEVEFDFSDYPGASPEGMTVIFYRKGSSRPSTYEFKGSSGGKVNLAPGVYKAICHNNDSDRHGYISTHSYDEMGIRVIDNRDAAERYGLPAEALRNENERLAHYPDSLWVASIDNFVVEVPDRNESSQNAPSQRITFEMQSVVSCYKFYIHNVINFQSSLSPTATISGMAGTVHPGQGKTGEETVTHLFSLSRLNDGSLYGEMLTFGHCASNDFSSRTDSRADASPHILVIRAMLNNGTYWESTHDVTEQIHNSEDKDCIIHIYNLEFPPASGPGGFYPTVGEWGGQKEEITM